MYTVGSELHLTFKHSQSARYPMWCSKKIRQAEWVRKVKVWLLFHTLALMSCSLLFSPLSLGDERNRNKRFVFRFSSASTGYLARKFCKFVILWIDLREDIFPVHCYSESESNLFRELQIFRFFSCQISCTGTAGTGIQILGSCSAHPLPESHFFSNQLRPCHKCFEWIERIKYRYFWKIPARQLVLTFV